MPSLWERLPELDLPRRPRRRRARREVPRDRGEDGVRAAARDRDGRPRRRPRGPPRGAGRDRRAAGGLTSRTLSPGGPGRAGTAIAPAAASERRRRSVERAQRRQPAPRQRTAGGQRRRRVHARPRSRAARRTPTPRRRRSRPRGRARASRSSPVIPPQRPTFRHTASVAPRARLARSRPSRPRTTPAARTAASASAPWTGSSAYSSPAGASARRLRQRLVRRRPRAVRVDPDRHPRPGGRAHRGDPARVVADARP